MQTHTQFQRVFLFVLLLFFPAFFFKALFPYFFRWILIHFFLLLFFNNFPLVFLDGKSTEKNGFYFQEFNKVKYTKCKQLKHNTIQLTYIFIFVYENNLFFSWELLIWLQVLWNYYYFQQWHTFNHKTNNY